MAKKYLFLIILLYNSTASFSQNLCNDSSILYAGSPFYLILDTASRKANLEYFETFRRNYFKTDDSLIRIDSSINTYEGNFYKIIIINFDSIKLVRLSNPKYWWYTKRIFSTKKKYYEKYLLKATNDESNYYTTQKNINTTINAEFEKEHRDILYPFFTDDPKNKKQTPLQVWKKKNELLCYDEYCKLLIEFENELVKRKLQSIKLNTN